MYYYIYDSWLNNKKYKKTVARIETRLTDLGINGKINHLSFLKNIEQVLAEEVRRGVKTIVVVGNDKTVGQIINIAAHLNTSIGIIPVGEKNKIANMLGIPEGEKACDTLSSRIIKRIDLGVVNNYYFLTSIEMIGSGITIECDNNYIINLEQQESVVNISNLNQEGSVITDPTDNKLNIFIYELRRKIIKKTVTSQSRITTKNARISAKKPLPILLTDEKKIIKTPINVKAATKKIRIIVGKKRLYKD